MSPQYCLHQSLTHINMRFLAALASLALVSARSIKIDEIEYGFCGGYHTGSCLQRKFIQNIFTDGANQPGTIDSVVVEPFPISLHTGASIKILAQLTLNEPVPEGATLSLNLKKEGLIPLPIPCLEINGLHIGSCTYDAGELIARPEICEFLVPDHVPEGQGCTLPLNPGVYGGEPAIEGVIPEIPHILLDLIGAGTYSAEAVIDLADGTQMTCIQLRVQVE